MDEIRNQSPFFREGISIWINDQKLYSNMSNHISDAYHHDRVKEYLTEKYHMNNSQFESINWQASKKSMANMHPTKCQWTAKYVSHFLPIVVNMVQRTQWCKEYCPRCKNCEETHKHLFHCQHPQSQMLYRKALDDMKDWLTSQNTPDTLPNGGSMGK